LEGAKGKEKPRQRKRKKGEKKTKQMKMLPGAEAKQNPANGKEKSEKGGGQGSTKT